MRFNVYEVTVLWDSLPKRTYVHMSDTTPLVEMRLLHSHSLYVEVKDSGRVVIQASG